jgi:hypothetical protein
VCDHARRINTWMRSGGRAEIAASMGISGSPGAGGGTDAGGGAVSGAGPDADAIAGSPAHHSTTA